VGIVPYVSPVANGYSDICRAHDIHVGIPFNLRDIYVALPLKGIRPARLTVMQLT